MERNDRLIGLLLHFINDADYPPIGVDMCGKDGDIILFDVDYFPDPQCSTIIDFDPDFDKYMVYDHYLIMLNDGLVIKHEWCNYDKVRNQLSHKHAVRLTDKGCRKLAEYEKR